MSMTRPTKKLSGEISVMAFELAAEPITKKLDAAEAKSEAILASLKMAAQIKRGARNAADLAKADASIVALTADHDAISDVIFDLQEQLIALQAALPGLPTMEKMREMMAAA